MTASLGPKGFADLVPVSRETLARLEAYVDLLTRWSVRINLVGRDTLADLWRRHILDSAQLHRFIPSTAKTLIDVGSGAGLPGLVLAILGVAGVELVEADSRKAAFLREAARVTDADVTIRPCRIQAVPPHPANVVTARACAPLPFFIYCFAARSGYPVSLAAIERVRSAVGNLAGLKVSESPWEIR